MNMKIKNNINEKCHQSRERDSLINIYLVDALYLAHTMVSLKRNKCLNFLLPSVASIMKLSFTSRLCVLS